MATNLPPMVASILALRSSLPPVSDELRKRVQSIRVRSIQESGSGADKTSWRNRANNSPPGSNGNSSPGGGNWRQASGQGGPGGPPRYTNSSPRPSISRPHSFQNFSENSPAATPNPGPPARYSSKFHNGSKVGDDQILNMVILNKLNVFSIKTYDEVKQFLFQILGSDQKEFVRDFTWLVFRKAAAEDKFCGLFAKLLSEIKKEYPVILEEMKKLHTTYLDIWKCSDSEETKVDRRCRLGYSQFLAELTVLGVLDFDTMRNTLETLKTCITECLYKSEHAETVEEYMDCLRKLCGAKIPKDLREMIRDLLVADMNSWIKIPREAVPGLSSKSRFACMDLRDVLCNA